jgi:drug/metabolite transporter (DMT)-like permease
MIYLAASIVSSTAIFVIFRMAKNYSCRLNILITLNYLVASLLGVVFLTGISLRPFVMGSHWIPFGISLGVLFIVMFFLIGNSSQKAGITVTTLANKMSLVFPVLFSMFWFNEKITLLKILGLILALAAVGATLYKKNIRKVNPSAVFLPLIIFAGSGFIDSLIKYIQSTQLTVSEIGSFSTFVFFVAFVCGSVFLFSVNRKIIPELTISTLILGILLGISNFGSLYFFINALIQTPLDSSLVFAINNMLIVALSATAGRFIFREQLNRINLAGLMLAFISLIILL